MSIELSRQVAEALKEIETLKQRFAAYELRTHCIKDYVTLSQRIEALEKQKSKTLSLPK